MLCDQEMKQPRQFGGRSRCRLRLLGPASRCRPSSAGVIIPSSGVVSMRCATGGHPQVAQWFQGFSTGQATEDQMRKARAVYVRVGEIRGCAGGIGIKRRPGWLCPERLGIFQSRDTAPQPEQRQTSSSVPAHFIACDLEGLTALTTACRESPRLTSLPPATRSPGNGLLVLAFGLRIAGSANLPRMAEFSFRSLCMGGETSSEPRLHQSVSLLD